MSPSGAAIYTLGELAVVADQRPEPADMRNLHARKTAFDRTIEPLQDEDD